MGMHKSGERPVCAKSVISPVVQAKRRARGSRFLANERGAFGPLDVHVSPTLQRRMVELGLAPILDLARQMSPLRSALFDQSLATKIVQ